MHGVGLTQVCMGMGAHSDSPAPGAGVSVEGETYIQPDLATLRQVPWRETHYIAQVNMRTSSGDMHGHDVVPTAVCKTGMRNLQEGIFAEASCLQSSGCFSFTAAATTAAGQAWDCCPRNALRKALAALHSEFGVTMKVCSTHSLSARLSIWRDIRISR